jgi:hypothetical protein
MISKKLSLPRRRSSRKLKLKERELLAALVQLVIIHYPKA